MTDRAAALAVGEEFLRRTEGHSSSGVCCDCSYSGKEETPCRKRDDKTHCEHWWDGPDYELPLLKTEEALNAYEYTGSSGMQSKCQQLYRTFRYVRDERDEATGAVTPARRGSKLLAALGASRKLICSLVAEMLHWHPWGALEQDDLWQLAATTVWEFADHSPAYIRQRVHWRFCELLNAERRQHGWRRPYGGRWEPPT